MTFIIPLGGIDLSVGSAVALTGVVVARQLRGGAGVAQAVAMGVLTAALAGLITGVLTTRARLTPFIVTLGRVSVLRGLAKGFADEQKIDADPRGLGFRGPRRSRARRRGRSGTVGRRPRSRPASRSR